MKNVFETFKAWCERVTGGFAPWWAVPLSAVVVLAILL